MHLHYVYCDKMENKNKIDNDLKTALKNHLQKEIDEHRHLVDMEVIDLRIDENVHLTVKKDNETIWNSDIRNLNEMLNDEPMRIRVSFDGKIQVRYVVSKQDIRPLVNRMIEEKEIDFFNLLF